MSLAREEFENWWTTGEPESAGGIIALQSPGARNVWKYFSAGWDAEAGAMLRELAELRRLWLQRVESGCALGDKDKFFERGIAMGLLIAANVIDGRPSEADNVLVPEFEIKEIDD